MPDRLTRWEGRDQDGPRAVLVKRDHFPSNLQEALRKLARYEDMEDAERDLRESVTVDPGDMSWWGTWTGGYAEDGRPSVAPTEGDDGHVH